MEKDSAPSRYVTATQLLRLGRLGNQLFIISAVIAYANEHQATPIFPYWKYSKCLETPFPCLKNIAPKWTFEHLLPWKQHLETKQNKYSPILNTSKWLDLYGFFQSEKYFKSQEPYIRKVLKPKQAIIDKLVQKYHALLANSPVSLHIRRGDYLELGGNISLSSAYYQEAIQRLGKDRAYLLFSDDPEWCTYNCRFLAKNLTILSGNSEFEDLVLMSMCQDHITANSSFSWWGAWLNPSVSKRVLTPKNWIFLQDVTQTDLIPKTWEVVSF